MLTIEDIKRKSRKTLQKMVLKMSEAVSEASSSVPVAVAEPVQEQSDIRKTRDGVELSLKLELDDETYQYLKTVCDGRGESFSACISENIRFSRENGFL